MPQLPESDLAFVSHALAEHQAALKDAHLLITGASGFIGAWLVESLHHLATSQGLNIKLDIVTRDAAAYRRKFPHLADWQALQVIESDIRRLDHQQHCHHAAYDYIIHGATDASTHINTHHPLQMAETIAQGTKAVLDIARICMPKKLLFLSSGAVYGAGADSSHTSEQDITRAAPDCFSAKSAYSEAKRYGELLCAIYQKEHGVPSNSARCYAFIGPGLPLDGSYAVGNFMRQLLAGKDLHIHGDGTAMRSNMYAADLAAWLWHILLKAPAGEAYNIGSEHAHSIKEMAEAMHRACGSSAKIIIEGNPGLASCYVPSTSKARALGLVESYSFEDAAKRMYQWCAQHQQDTDSI